MKKYRIVCRHCGREIGGFGEWFGMGQRCGCGSSAVHVEYAAPPSLASLFASAPAGGSFQHLYFDCLPIERRESIVTLGEGLVPIERWESLEAAGRLAGADCEVYVCRNDLNGGSGTFKDISAALAATVLAEQGISDYCLASTGNAGAAFAAYLARAGVRFTEFAPSSIDEETLAFIRAAGQRVEVASGGYGAAKAAAAAYHEQCGVLISGGNTDPLRIESKRTLAFECFRQTGGLPTVYLQAVAGGTSPLAFEKGCCDLAAMGVGPQPLPRMLLVQQDECDPMVSAYEQAARLGFPDGWERQYAEKRPCRTRVGILSAANPGNYPLLAPLVRRSGGAFLRVSESLLPILGRRIWDEQRVLLGPASVVAVAGFFRALGQRLLRDGDRVLLNIGEGAARSAWFRRAMGL